MKTGQVVIKTISDITETLLYLFQMQDTRTSLLPEKVREDIRNTSIKQVSFNLNLMHEIR